MCYDNTFKCFKNLKNIRYDSEMIKRIVHDHEDSMNISRKDFSGGITDGHAVLIIGISDNGLLICIDTDGQLKHFSSGYFHSNYIYKVL